MISCEQRGNIHRRLGTRLPQNGVAMDRAASADTTAALLVK